jgi:outer membrane protein assembly factor BamB
MLTAPTPRLRNQTGFIPVPPRDRILWLTLFCAAVVPVMAGDTWPQWRGPSRDGQFHGRPWPTSLDTNHLQQRWRVNLAPSYSGPIVSTGTVFVTETVNRTSERVRALDRTTGATLWEREWTGALSVPFFAKSNGDWIRATPALDGKRLYVAGMRDVLVCLDTDTGEEIWRVDFVARFKTPLPAFGYVSSPLIDGDWLYTQAGASVVKLRKDTGEVVWRSMADEGGMWGSVFSSPVLATLADRSQLVVQSRTTLAGLDPGTGTVLWSQAVEAFRGMNILTPVVFGEGVFTSTYGGKTLFHRVTAQDGSFTVSKGWENKTQGYMSTPVVIEGHAYHHLKNQRFACFDLTTGEEKWMTPGGFGKYWSLVAQGKTLLALDQRGLLYLLEASPEEFRLKDERKVSEEETWAHLAVVDGWLYIRELRALAAWEWRAP